MNTVGEGKYKVWLQCEEMDNDLIYILGGGETPHIGGVVLKIPKKEIMIMKLEGHYDLEVLIPIAEAAADKNKKKVVALGGVHIDNASKDDIDQLVSNCKELIKCI